MTLFHCRRLDDDRNFAPAIAHRKEQSRQICDASAAVLGSASPPSTGQAIAILLSYRQIMFIAKLNQCNVK